MMFRRICILRLSSLGDVVLATSVLNALPADQRVDWVVSRAFAPVLESHPRIHRLWIFDPASGRAGWRALVQELFLAGYTDIWDLHGSLRTRLARFWFWLWGLSAAERPTWRCVKKARWRRRGYAVFKSLWPISLRPSPWREVFCRTVGLSGHDAKPMLPDFEKRPRPGDLPSRFFCVMPASRWPGKQWPAENFADLAARLAPEFGTPVILGTDNDEASQDLVQVLSARGVPHFNGVGRWGLPDVGRVLSESTAYLGCDTGLAHMAEAVGTRAFVVFGPNRADMGFGPWRAESRVLERKNLWCRPCGKDGRNCHRLLARHVCLRGLSVETAESCARAPK